MTENTMTRVPARRSLLSGGGKAILSASAIALLGGHELLAAKLAHAADPKKDVQILNTARGLELEGINVYQIAAESGLVTPDTLKVAVYFQSQHRDHAETLAETIRKLGGRPVDPKSKDEYAKVVTAAAPKNEADVLRLASKLEKGAANAYLGTIQSLTDPALSLICARIAADEVMHFTALTLTLKEALPPRSMSFGA